METREGRVYDLDPMDAREQIFQRLDEELRSSALDRGVILVLALEHMTHEQRVEFLVALEQRHQASIGQPPLDRCEAAAWASAFLSALARAPGERA